MDISDVSKACGLPASTLRFYEEKGLIQSVGRNGLKRTFEANILERVGLISLARSVDFSLDEIREIFIHDGEVNRELLLAKADKLDNKIKELTAMRNGLHHAAKCSAPNHFECPKFLRLLKLAGKNRFRQPSKIKKAY